MNSTREIIVNPGNYTYEKISHIEMLETLRKYYEYPIEIFNAVDDGAYAGKHSTPISDKYELLETDYKKQLWFKCITSLSLFLSLHFSPLWRHTH